MTTVLHYCFKHVFHTLEKKRVVNRFESRKTLCKFPVTMMMKMVVVEINAVWCHDSPAVYTILCAVLCYSTHFTVLQQYTAEGYVLLSLYSALCDAAAITVSVLQ